VINYQVILCNLKFLVTLYNKVSLRNELIMNCTSTAFMLISTFTNTFSKLKMFYLLTLVNAL